MARGAGSEWKLYFGILVPGRVQPSVHAESATGVIAEHGDKLDVPRVVDHTVFFASVERPRRRLTSSAAGVRGKRRSSCSTTMETPAGGLDAELSTQRQHLAATHRRVLCPRARRDHAARWNLRRLGRAARHRRELRLLSASRAHQ
jgi:hypothetical protein